MTNPAPDATPDTAAASDTATTVAAVEQDASARRTEAEAILKNHMLVALGAGAVPIPFVDVATFLGANVNLVRRLCQVYGVPFKGHRVHSVILALASALGAGSMASFAGMSLGKLIPGGGAVIGAITLPVATTGFTYTVGKLFIGHFEAGGTLLDFSVASQISHVKALFAAGKSEAASMMSRNQDRGASPAAAES